MKKNLLALLCCFIVLQSFGQTQRGVSAYLLGQYNETLYDYTLGNNPWSMGLGLQAMLNNKTRFKPTIEVTSDLYLEDDYVLRANPDGTFPEEDNTVSGMVNLFAGSFFQVTRRIYLSFTAGPSFITDKTFFGIKPSAGIYFPRNRRLTCKISYINVFNRTKMINADFGSLSLSVGLKLF
jgi:hypothetical protein